LPFTSDLEVGLQRYRQGGVLWLRPAGAGLRALGQPPGGASWPCLPSRSPRRSSYSATPEGGLWASPTWPKGHPQQAGGASRGGEAASSCPRVQALVATADLPPPARKRSGVAP